MSLFELGWAIYLLLWCVHAAAAASPSSGAHLTYAQGGDYVEDAGAAAGVQAWYVDADGGSDANDGRAPDRAWRTAVQALRLSLTRMFVPEYWHWPALLGLQRFAMVATPLFVNDTLKSSVVLAFIVFFMQNLQLSFAPYANADVNMHQKLASDCLLALALLVVPLRVLAQASVDVDAPGQEPLKRACDGLGTAMAPFLLAPILLPLLAMAAKSLLKGTGAAWRARAATASKRRATRSTTTVAADAGMLDNPGVDQGVDVEPREGSAAEAHNAL